MTAEDAVEKGAIETQVERVPYALLLLKRRRTRPIHSKLAKIRTYISCNRFSLILRSWPSSEKLSLRLCCSARMALRYCSIISRATCAYEVRGMSVKGYSRTKVLQQGGSLGTAATENGRPPMAYSTIPCIPTYTPCRRRHCGGACAPWALPSTRRAIWRHASRYLHRQCSPRG